MFELKKHNVFGLWNLLWDKLEDEYGYGLGAGIWHLLNKNLGDGIETPLLRDLIWGEIVVSQLEKLK